MNNWEKTLDEIITFRNSNGIIVTRYQEIIYCSADRSYSIIHTEDSSGFMVSYNLGSIQSLLPKPLFIRIHKKYLVNKLHVKKIVINGTSRVILSNGKELEVSTRKKKDIVKEFLNIL